LVLPVGLCPPPAAPTRAADATEADETNARPLTLVYAGTLGVAHDPALLTALAARLEPHRLRLTLALSGCQASALRRSLAGHPAIDWRTHLTLAELSEADGHLVSLAAPATHLCVPSKAVTAVCLGRPFLFAGCPEADTWQTLGAAGWLIPPGCENELEAALLSFRSPQERARRAAAARSLAVALHRQERESLNTLATLIAGWSQPFRSEAPYTNGL
jgi:hypothetical protein